MHLVASVHVLPIGRFFSLIQGGNYVSVQFCKLVIQGDRKILVQSIGPLRLFYPVVYKTGPEHNPHPVVTARVIVGNAVTVAVGLRHRIRIIVTLDEDVQVAQYQKKEDEVDDVVHLGSNAHQRL